MPEGELGGAAGEGQGRLIVVEAAAVCKQKSNMRCFAPTRRIGAKARTLISLPVAVPRRVQATSGGLPMDESVGYFPILARKSQLSVNFSMG